MRVLFDFTGSQVLQARAHDIAPTTAVREGQVVKLVNGFVEPAAVGETAPVLGVAAQSHSGAADALHPESNGKTILVYDSPTLVAGSVAPKLVATGGTNTTVTAATAAFAAEDFKGGYLELAEKSPNSALREGKGFSTRIVGYSNSGGVSTFAVEGLSAAPVAGDCFVVYPPVGFAKGNLNSDRTALTLAATAALSLRVVGREKGLVLTMAALHEFGSKRA